MGAVVVPLEEEVVLWVPIDPEVAVVGFSAAFLEVVDAGFIDLKDGGGGDFFPK